MLAVSHVIVTGLTVFSTSCSLGIVICIDKASQPTQIFDANYVSHCVECKGSLPAPVVRNASCWAKDGHLFGRYRKQAAVTHASWLVSRAATGFACLAQQQAATLRRQAVNSTWLRHLAGLAACDQYGWWQHSGARPPSTGTREWRLTAPALRADSGYICQRFNLAV